MRSDVSRVTGLSDGDVLRAFFALAAEQPPFCSFSDVSTLAVHELDFARDPTGHARPTVGAWPTPENLADRIIAALAEEAFQETDPERKTRLKHAADVGKGVPTGVLTTVITQGR